MEANATLEKLVINGTEYVKASDVVQRTPGKRAVVVVDNGWIFAGDVEDRNGRIVISRAVNVFKWERIGFAAMVDNPMSKDVDIRKCKDVDVPSGAEVFRIPVDDNWGL